MIRMKTTAAGPDGTWSAGHEYGLPEDVERALVDGGYAAYVSEVETAEAAPAPENAAERTEKPNRSGGNVDRTPPPPPPETDTGRDTKPKRAPRKRKAKN